jgi:hypothetical protein
MDRASIYKAIDAERDFQDCRWGSLDNINSVGDFLCYMKRYLDMAIMDNNPEFPALSMANVRKLVAIGVAAGEKFGLPSR